MKKCNIKISAGDTIVKKYSQLLYGSILLFLIILPFQGISSGKNQADINIYRNHYGFSFSYIHENPFITIKEEFNFESGCSEITLNNYIGTVIKITAFDLDKNKSKYGSSEFYRPLMEHADSEFKKYPSDGMEKGSGFQKTSYKGNTAYSYSINSMHGEKRVIYFEKNSRRFILQMNNAFSGSLKIIENSLKFD